MTPSCRVELRPRSTAISDDPTTRLTTPPSVLASCLRSSAVLHKQVLQKVANPELDPPFRPHLEPATTPPQVRDLCSRCWLSDPAGRPTFQQLSVELRLMNVSDINSSMKALHVRPTTAFCSLACSASPHYIAPRLSARPPPRARLSSRVPCVSRKSLPQGGRTRRKRLDVDKALELKQSALLHKVFPPAVAAALLEDRQVEPQPFREVTIFFSVRWRFFRD